MKTITAAGIAHDINNQLTLIVNHLSLADIAAAQSAAARCSELTASLLSYCRGDAITLCRVDPVVFLREFAAELQLPPGVHLILNVPPALPAISANPLALTRALDNLISNACAAMEENGTLRIEAAPEAITLSDSGPGIPPPHSKQIFEPFFTTKGTNGTGLGLSIVRELMHQQGGSVTMHSEPGQGATFTLHLRPYGVTALNASPRKIAPAA